MKVHRPQSEAELKEVLAHLVAQPGVGPNDIRRQVNHILRYASQHQVSLEHCLFTRKGREVAAACLGLDAPGRTSTFYITLNIQDETTIDALASLVQRSVEQAARRGIRLVQTLLPPESDRETRVYDRSGFTYLAELIYMERQEEVRPLTDRATLPLTWASYSPVNHEMFARTIAGTYAGSLDCAALNGLREIEDVLATHKSIGEFNPSWWLVGLHKGEPVGTILLAYQPERASGEVVYMGVLPDWRGRGIGSALMHQAGRLARQHAISVLSLAVDDRNRPAKCLYARFGFDEVARRRAWIKSLPMKCDDAPRSNACF
jgi:GNAT superfamily N-acetyltransferase